MARKKANIHYLYKITCNVTGRWYIGMHSTSNLDDGYMGSGKRLRYSIRKHGLGNHIKEILEFFETRELLVEAEKKAITPEMITDKNCMNLAEGGCGGHGSRFLSKEQLSKGGVLSGELHKKRLIDDDEYSLKHKLKCSDNFKKLINSGKIKPFNWKGYSHSEESKKLMSKQKKGTGLGETNSQYGTCWITKDGVNKKIKKEEFETYLKQGWLKGRK